MSLSEDDYQRLIFANIGGDTVVDKYMPLLWEKNAPHAAQGLHLQYLYTWRDAIVLLAGQIWKDVTIDLPTRSQVAVREKWLNMLAMQRMVEGLIREYTATVEGISVDELETIVSLPGNVGYSDPNDPVYRGDITQIQIEGLGI